MFGPIQNPTTVHIPVVPTGCCQSEFDSTYPIHLNGIIRPDEFAESMNNINKAMGSKTEIIRCSIILAICFIFGIFLFILGGILSLTVRSSFFSIMIIAGIVIFIIGIVMLFCCNRCVQSNRASRVRKIVREESEKYSNRSGVPCSWRVDTTRLYNQMYRRSRHAHLAYHLMIDIGYSQQSTAPFRLATPPPSYSSETKRPMPPVYS